MSEHEPPLLEVQGVCKSVSDAGGELEIVRGISFAVPARYILARVGLEAYQPGLLADEPTGSLDAASGGCGWKRGSKSRAAL